MKSFLKGFGTSKTGKVVSERFKKALPQVQPKRWVGYEGLKRDGLLIMQLFFRSINFLKKGDARSESAVSYDSRDDYLRKEKLSPAQLKMQIKKMTWYSWICYALGTAIFAYSLYIFINVSILDSIICMFFCLFVLAKGLQFSLFIKQIKTGDFTLGLKQYFSRK